MVCCVCVWLDNVGFICLCTFNSVVCMLYFMLCYDLLLVYRFFVVILDFGVWCLVVLVCYLCLRSCFCLHRPLCLSVVWPLDWWVWNWALFGLWCYWFLAISVTSLLACVFGLFVILGWLLFTFWWVGCIGFRGLFSIAVWI